MQKMTKIDMLIGIKSSLKLSTYYGSLLFNFGAFVLPAFVRDSIRVRTTDVYTYIGVVVEVLNEGLPRTAWSLSTTISTVQAICGVILTFVFVGSSKRSAAALVPTEVRKTSLACVRISLVQALSSATEVAVASATRALDRRHAPLAIRSVKFVVDNVLVVLASGAGLEPFANASVSNCSNEGWNDARERMARPLYYLRGWLVFSFPNVCVILAFWAWFKSKGRVFLAAVP
ncbi:unnamed protein product [Diplocarpon coronariae]